MTPDTILVSWKPPALPNGVINQYTVYIQEGSVLKIQLYFINCRFLIFHCSFVLSQGEAVSHKLSAFQLNYEATDMKKKERYSFWVTASTNVGEGDASQVVSIAPGTRGTPSPSIIAHIINIINLNPF